MCKCLEEKINMTKELLKEKDDYYKEADINYVHFKHTLEIFLSQLNIPIIIEGTKLSKGETKKFKKERYFPAIFCPFCGEQWIEENINNKENINE